MRSRPGIIILLALCQIFSPIISFVTGAALSRITVFQYVNLFYHKNPVDFIFGFFGIPIILSFSIFSVKKWSIPVCIVATLWNMANSSAFWQHYDNWYTGTVLFIFNALNLGFIFYFLIPAVREIYIDKKLRWWESKPRYAIQKIGLIKTESETHSCKIDEISSEGTFINLEIPLQIGQSVSVEFELKEIKYNYSGKVVHQNIQNTSTYGLRFLHLNHKKKVQTKKLMKYLETSDIPRKPERVNAMIEFKNWFSTFIKTGEGIFPLPQERVPAANRKLIPLEKLIRKK